MKIGELQTCAKKFRIVLHAIHLYINVPKAKAKWAVVYVWDFPLYTSQKHPIFIMALSLCNVAIDRSVYRTINLFTWNVFAIFFLFIKQTFHISFQSNQFAEFMLLAAAAVITRECSISSFAILFFIPFYWFCLSDPRHFPLYIQSSCARTQKILLILYSIKVSNVPPPPPPSALFILDLFHWNASWITGKWYSKCVEALGYSQKIVFSQSFQSYVLFFILLNLSLHPIGHFYLFYSMAQFYHSICNRHSWRCIFIVWRTWHMFKICWSHECFQLVFAFIINLQMRSILRIIKSFFSVRRPFQLHFVVLL